jgi:CheY-like chemotaxis protein
MNTILVVDDNADYREILAEALRLEPFKILEAENGQIGLKKFHDYSPDFIICDVDMPVMTGIEVLTTVKSDPINAKIPFCIITGRRDEQLMKTSGDLGVVAYLTKPISISEVLAIIANW